MVNISENPVSANNNSHEIPEDFVMVDNQTDRYEMVKDVAGQVLLKSLNYGEYLTWAPWVPGSPDCLRSPTAQFIGKSCRLINAGLNFKSDVEKVFAPESTVIERMQGSVNATRKGIVLANKVIDIVEPIFPKTAGTVFDKGRQGLKKMDNQAFYAQWALRGAGLVVR